MTWIGRQLGKLKIGFLGLGIIRRMLLGYLFVIFLPVLGLGILYYNQVNERGLRNFAQSNQELIGQIRGNFEIYLAQIEALQQLFQFNSSLVDYMRGMYRTEADQVYEYKKNIEPAFAYVLATNPYLDAVRIYQKNPNVMPLGVYLKEWDERFSHDPVLSGLGPAAGKWIFASDNREAAKLTYYRKMYARDFTQEVGMLEIQASGRLFFQLFETIDRFRGANLYLVDRQGGLIVREEETELSAEARSEILRRANGEIGSFIDKSLSSDALVHYARIDSLDATVVFVTDIRKVYRAGVGENLMLLGYVALLLVLLSFIYYYISSSALRRMIKLARHMRRIDQNNLQRYRGDGYNDEIGIFHRQ